MGSLRVQVGVCLESKRTPATFEVRFPGMPGSAEVSPLGADLRSLPPDPGGGSEVGLGPVWTQK